MLIWTMLMGCLEPAATVPVVPDADTDTDADADADADTDADADSDADADADADTDADTDTDTLVCGADAPVIQQLEWANASDATGVAGVTTLTLEDADGGLHELSLAIWFDDVVDGSVDTTVPPPLGVGNTPLTDANGNPAPPCTVPAVSFGVTVPVDGVTIPFDTELEIAWVVIDVDQIPSLPVIQTVWTPAADGSDGGPDPIDTGDTGDTDPPIDTADTGLSGDEYAISSAPASFETIIGAGGFSTEFLSLPFDIQLFDSVIPAGTTVQVTDAGILAFDGYQALVPGDADHYRSAGVSPAVAAFHQTTLIADTYSFVEPGPNGLVMTIEWDGVYLGGVGETEFQLIFRENDPDFEIVFGTMEDDLFFATDWDQLVVSDTHQTEHYIPPSIAVSMLSNTRFTYTW